MNLHSQLALGNFGSCLVGIWWTIVFTAPIPLLIWLILSVILWFRKKRTSLKWWSIFVATCCVYGIIMYGYLKVFSGAPYMIAQRTNVYIPMSVQVLEDDEETTIDSHTEYEVIRFNQSQMDTFVKCVKARGWKYGTVVPYTLWHPNPNNYPDAMSGRKYPLPKVTRNGYFYSSIKKRYGTGDWHTTRMAYFLDVTTRILYIYFDDSQWG